MIFARCLYSRAFVSVGIVKNFSVPVGTKLHLAAELALAARDCNVLRYGVVEFEVYIANFGVTK